jgi:hypothetical protein
MGICTPTWLWLFTDLDLDIDQNTGEMRTKVVLDRELRTSYHLSAIPLSGDGENIKVLYLLL